MEQLSGMDAAFLHLETATLPQHVLGVILLDPAETDGGFSADVFRKMLADRIHLMPSFERKLVTVPLNLDNPYWQHVDDIDLDAHVHEISCPEPGDLDALGRLVGEIGSTRLDRSRPLWELYLVDGMAQGKVAIIAKLHHCTMYGAAGANMMANLLDLEPKIRQVEPRDPAEHDPPPSRRELLARAGLATVRRPVKVGRVAIDGARRAVAIGGTVARSVTGRTPLSAPFTAPRSAINGRLTSARQAAFSSVDFDDLKAIKEHFEVKVNDVVLAAVAGSLRAYLLEHGGLPKGPLRASVPMQAGEGDVQGTDKITALLVSLPLAVEDPAERLKAIATFTEHSKGLADAMGHDMIGDLAELVPPPLLIGGAQVYEKLGASRLHPPLQSLVVSNMPGPPVPLYCAMTRVESVFPLGPLLAGSGLNVTVLSNMGRLDVGLLCCPDIVEDVWAIADGFPAAVAKLRALV